MYLIVNFYTASQLYQEQEKHFVCNHTWINWIISQTWIQFWEQKLILICTHLIEQLLMLIYETEKWKTCILKIVQNLNLKWVVTLFIFVYHFFLFHCKLLFPTSCLLPWVDSLHIFQNSARDLRQKWPICLVLSHNLIKKILREFLKRQNLKLEIIVNV